MQHCNDGLKQEERNRWKQRVDGEKEEVESARKIDVSLGVIDRRTSGELCEEFVSRRWEDGGVWVGD